MVVCNTIIPIVVNGAMKTGTHLLLRCVELFGQDEVRHAHDPYRDFSGRKVSYGTKVQGKHLHIIRHPKNILISWCRYVYQDDSEQILIDNMFRAVRPVMAFAGWIDESGVHTVRFEDLLTKPEEVDKIGEYLGLSPVMDHFERMQGGGPTFTGNPSVWQEHWTSRLQQHWEEAGGPAAERAYGYQD